MALSEFMTLALAGPLQRGMRVASMGYPDIIAPLAIVNRMLGDKVSELQCRLEDGEAICRRHGLESRLIPDAESFFKLMGCTLDVFDIVRERGCEILLDLNLPILGRSWKEPKINRYSYDVVLDVGTLEHCFNIAQAAFNMASLVKEGGYILHENPFNWGNHGFYNLNPTWYADFYAANGFKIVDLQLVTRDGRTAQVPHTKRFNATGEEVNVLTVAQRVEFKPETYPVQSKYAKLISSVVQPLSGVGISGNMEAYGSEEELSMYELPCRRGSGARN